MINPDINLDELNRYSRNTILEQLNIQFTDIGKDYLCAKMPVDHRTKQPAGILHGGASVVLAETLGSLAAELCTDREVYTCVGLDINANHIRSVTEGFVHGKATPIHIGRSTQIWQIKIKNDEGKLTCISRITMAVLQRK